MHHEHHNVTLAQIHIHHCVILNVSIYDMFS